MKDIKIYIVETDFKNKNVDVLGRKLGDYIYNNISDYEKINSLSEINADIDCKYLGVFYNYMPLMTDVVVEEVLEYLAEDGNKCLSVGDGFVCTKDCFKDIDLDNMEIKFQYSGLESMTCNDNISFPDIYQELSYINIDKALENGALIYDRVGVYIDNDVVIEENAVIYPNVTIKGNSVIESGAILRSGTVIENSIIKSGANILSSYIYDSKIGENTTVGPCSLIRANSDIGKNIRIGDFVEIKNSKLDEGCKAAHLTYVGDAELGKRVNLGCGTVFANYNGKIKQKTFVGDDAFIGSNTNLVAPVKVGNKAFTAAGSTVTDDVPDDTLCIARSRQVHKDLKN